MAAAAAVLGEADADASLREELARALEANQRWEQCAAELRAENERLREELARRDAELEQVKAALAVLQRMVFGRSSERTGPQVGGGTGGEAGTGEDRGPARWRGRAGNARRDYSHLPRVEVIWDFEDGGYCCERCGTAFESLGDHVIEQIDWHVSVRLVVHRRRRYRRRCRCPVPVTVMAPGPPKAIGKGLFSNGFLALLFTERYVAGRSLHSLTAGLARHGADISDATLAGVLAQAGKLLAPVQEAVIARSRASWHLHADETSWRVFAPREGGGPARWWLWVFLAPGHRLLREGLLPRRGGAGPPRRDPASRPGSSPCPSQAAGRGSWSSPATSPPCTPPPGRRQTPLVNLFCWAHLRRHFLRAGDANPAQLTYWTAAWLERIKNLYAAHEELMAAWADGAGQAAAPLEEARAAWDTALAAIDTARQQQRAAPGLQESAKKALATLDREWDAPGRAPRLPDGQPGQ